MFRIIILEQCNTEQNHKIDKMKTNICNKTNTLHTQRLKFTKFFSAIYIHNILIFPSTEENSSKLKVFLLVY